MFIARIESLHVAKNESSLSFKIDTNRIFRFLYPKNRMKLAEQSKKIVQASNIFQYEPPLDETHHQEDDKNSKKKRIVYHR